MRNILVLVEGMRPDVKLMERLLEIYGIDGYRIVPYKTNIYALYHSLSRNGNQDILLHLREREPNPEKRVIFDERYSDILLIFDLDPQDNRFSPERISEISEYFNNSTENGQLYINYPMVEAFFHVKKLPTDPQYADSIASLEELKAGGYKTRAAAESVVRSKNAFLSNREDCSAVIRQNLEKAWRIVGGEPERLPPSQAVILAKQLDKLSVDTCVAILCTCVFYIVDYNPRLVRS